MNVKNKLSNPFTYRGFFIALVVIILLFLLPSFAGEYWVHLASVAMIYTILALSLNMLYGFAGQISFGHAGFFGMGAYILTILETKFDLPFEIAFLITMIVSFLVTYIIAFPILKLKEHYLGMATLAFGLLIFAIAMQWVTVTGGPSGMPVPAATLFGVPLSEIIYYIVIISTALVYLISIIIYHSKMGYALRAIAGDEWAAQAAGINIVRYKTIIFAISGTVAAFAGILYAKLLMFISPEAFSLHVSVLILTMVVIGGLGSNIGAVIGAVFLTLVPEMITFLQDYSTLFYGVILLLVLIFMPKGLVSLPGAIKGSLQRKIKEPKMIEKEGA